MEHNEFIISYPGFFSSEFRGETLWIRFSGNFFHNFLSFDNRDFLQEFFEDLAEAKDIKTVVIHSAFSESGRDEYMRFFLMECPERNLGNFGFSNTMDRYELHRFCNIIDRTIMNIVQMDKIIIHICGGPVLSLFMNISLACDYRIVAEDTIFHNIFQEIGMLPKGGAPFFLNRAASAGSTASLLLLKQRITAQDALANGIANEIVPEDEIESAAMEAAEKFEMLPLQTLYGTKRLANYPFQQLKEYLAYETEQIIKIGHRKDFNDQ